MSRRIDAPLGLAGEGVDASDLARTPAVPQTPPDLSLERDGVALRDLLWRLLDEDRAAREAAGEALQAMEFGMPSVHTHFEELTEMPRRSPSRQG